MKSWVKPVTEVQKFEANEYVAACWGVGCDVKWSNDYEKRQGDYWNGVTHDSAHCGNSSNQVIFDYDDDGTADAMIETGTDGLGNLNCTIFSDPSYRGCHLLDHSGRGRKNMEPYGYSICHRRGSSQPFLSRCL